MNINPLYSDGSQHTQKKHSTDDLKTEKAGDLKAELDKVTDNKVRDIEQKTKKKLGSAIKKCLVAFVLGAIALAGFLAVANPLGAPIGIVGSAFVCLLAAGVGGYAKYKHGQSDNALTALLKNKNNEFVQDAQAFVNSLTLEDPDLESKFNDLKYVANLLGVDSKKQDEFCLRCIQKLMESEEGFKSLKGRLNLQDLDINKPITFDDYMTVDERRSTRMRNARDLNLMSSALVGIGLFSCIGAALWVGSLGSGGMGLAGLTILKGGFPLGHAGVIAYYVKNPDPKKDNSIKKIKNKRFFNRHRQSINEPKKLKEKIDARLDAMAKSITTEDKKRFEKARNQIDEDWKQYLKTIEDKKFNDFKDEAIEKAVDIITQRIWWVSEKDL